jgi:hypothetical protein
MTDGPQVFGKREHPLRAALRVVEEQDLGHAGSLSGSALLQTAGRPYGKPYRAPAAVVVESRA